MNKDSRNGQTIRGDDMRPEYDLKTLSGGVRGKYYNAYREGHTVKIHKADGTVDVHYFTLEDGAVMLEPDVQRYFPDSDAVNKALRCLIPLVGEREKSNVKA
ncbi:hypothetical protein GF339_01765 [candidate division KSB3 bacterium]|uniref:Uncharacterized protein n=1 Tax=candidate division KSB3 bacterium TaxID=2044937 RepID=A0A9D5Q4H7_9BACT|nr:hypothetical protein [candidate division KSB3 bacterium]MBD3323278.1 hypothetical protein [candidate division KSB3 bacterium]